MDGLFLDVLNMSVSAGWLILAVIVIRFFMGKAPKGLRYVLWALVGVRLLCPISIESALSMIPSAEIFSEESMYSDKPEIHSGVVVLDEVINPILSEQISDENTMHDIDASLNHQGTQNNIGDTNTTGESNKTGNSNVLEKEETTIQNAIHVMAWIWGLGIAGMLIYAIGSYVRLRHTINASMHLRDNLWVCDEIQSPFILGFVHPRIYMPSFIEEEQIPYIVAHEDEHLKYHDHWWKPLGFAILAFHWFNPLVWGAYILLCRDIELACDERVIQSMNSEEMKNYSKSLLLCSNVRHIISACPVAFGEIGVKERIKSIVNYKKPAVWVVGIGIVVCMVIAICFMTNPKQDSEIGGTEDTQQGTEVVEDGTLDEATLKWFDTEFFNNDEDRMPNMFLASEYSKPADVDLHALFYDGASTYYVSEKERQLLQQKYGIELELDVAKVSRQEMDEVLKKYTGLTREETNQINLNNLYYLEEYDAFYNVAGDTRYSIYLMETGWINENGSITLQYHDISKSYVRTCLVTLRKVDGGYHFVSNLIVGKDIVVDVGVRDEELTLMQKVLFNKKTYNGDTWIGEVNGIYWSDSNDDYWEYVKFFTVDLDRDGVDEVCVEFAPGLILIFHEEDGVIYGYETFFRAFNPVYVNGTFAGSSGAAYTSLYGNVKFDKNGFSYEEVVSDFYINEYSGIPVEKYDFTVENILKYVNEPTSKVKVLETNSDIDGLEMKIEVFHRENDVPSKIEILFENNTSETLRFGKSKVYYQDGEKWKKAQSLEEISLLELCGIMSMEDVELANQATGENYSNTILHTAYPWRDYYMKSSGTYKIEFTFQNDEHTEIGRAWIIIEQE